MSNLVLPQGEREWRLGHLFAEFIAERLPPRFKKGARTLLASPWEEMKSDQQDHAVRLAFAAGVAATGTYARLVSILAKRRATPMPRGDPRARAFRLGRDRASRPLLRLLFGPWAPMDRAGKILAIELSEFLGRQSLGVTVPIVELIARLPDGPGQNPLNDPRIRALERGAKRALTLEAALHRLGLAELPNNAMQQPVVHSQPLLGLAVTSLRRLGKSDDSWRSFPGIWVALEFSGRPTKALCFIAPEGRARRDPRNFVGAWLALACDCFVFAATCRRKDRANLAAIAGCALLALAPHDDRLGSRTKLHVSDDVALLAGSGCKVDRRVHDIARRIAAGLLRSDVPEQELEIVRVLETSGPLVTARKTHAEPRP